MGCCVSFLSVITEKAVSLASIPSIAKCKIVHIGVHGFIGIEFDGNDIDGYIIFDKNLEFIGDDNDIILIAEELLLNMTVNITIEKFEDNCVHALILGDPASVIKNIYIKRGKKEDLSPRKLSSIEEDRDEDSIREFETFSDAIILDTEEDHHKIEPMTIREFYV